MTKPNVNITVGGYSKQEAREIVLKAGIPLQDQMTETNVKYVVKWDFDLNGSSLLIPANSTVVFDGGRFKNGEVLVNAAKIYPDYNSILGNGITAYGMPAEGTFYYNDNKPLWSNGTIWVDAVYNLGVLGIIKKVDVSSDIVAEEHPLSGTQTNVIYDNVTDHDVHVNVSATVNRTPDGDIISITIPAGGYGEVNFMNINGIIYARGI